MNTTSQYSKKTSTTCKPRKKHWKTRGNHKKKKCLDALENFTNEKLPDQMRVMLLFAGGNENTNAFAHRTRDVGFFLYRRAPTKKSLQEKIEVLIHELTHISHMKNGKDKLLNALHEKHGLSKQRSLFILEAITDCLAPNGFLARDLFGTKPSLGHPRKNEKINYIARNMTKRLIFDLVKDYYEHKEQQDFWNDLLPKIVEKTSKQYP